MLVTEHNYQEALAFIRESDDLALDTETDGLHPWTGNWLIGISVARPHNGEMTSYYFPFRHQIDRHADTSSLPLPQVQGDNLPLSTLPEVLDALAGVQHLILFNGKFDLQVLYQEGFQRFDGWEEVQLAAHLMNENEPTFALKRLADKYLGPGSSMDEAALGSLIKSRYGQKASKGDLWRLPAAEVSDYACSDTELTYRLRDFYLPHLENWDLLRLYHEVNHYNHVINQMEIRGIRIDRALIHELLEEVDPNLERLLREITDLAGFPLNPRSPKQIVEATGLPNSKAETLQEFADDIPMAAKILEFREWAKAKNTYYDPYLTLADADDVIHTSFWLSGTVSGRLSSRGPNLQQVPRGTAAYKVKECFIPRDGYLLSEIDYEQAELRLAAHYSQDARLIEIFNAGRDPYLETAKLIEEAVGKPVTRQQAKTIVLGIQYGMGITKFSQQLRCSVPEAKQLIGAFKRQFPGLERLMRQCEAQIMQYGRIRIPSGRYRRFESVEKAYKGINSLIQGTAAEVVRYAMCRIHEEVPEVHLLLQVHDSVVLEVPEGSLYLLAEVQRIMEDFAFNPQMKVEVKVGRSWGDMEKYTSSPAQEPSRLLTG